MAIQIPQGLYSGFTEVLDSNPTANRAYQQRVRKQAKMDALDEYDRNRINNINSTGVRDKDRQVFDESLQAIRDYYNKNKDNIRKGTTPEAYEYEKLFRNVSSLINKSKERTARQDAAMKLWHERLKQDGVTPDDFINELELNDRGIMEEGSVAFDLPKWMSSPKPFNQQTYIKGYGDIKRTPTVRTEAVEGQPLRVNEITEETFDTGGKQTIALRAADKYENSYSFREQVKTEVKDPVARARMEQTFKDQYGTMPQSNEDYATAYTLELLQPKITKSKIVDNKDAIMTRREKFAREIQGRIDARQAYGIAARRAFQVADQQAQDDYVETMWEAYKKNGSLDPQIVGDYQKSDSKGHKVPIDKQVFNPDGTVDLIVYKVDKDGNMTTEVDEAYSTRKVPAPQIKARIRKELETPMTNTQGNPTQSKPNSKTSKTVSLSTLKSLVGQKGYEGYTIDEIIKYYKSNGYIIK
jgi:hypothetical protein